MVVFLKLSMVAVFVCCLAACSATWCIALKPSFQKRPVTDREDDTLTISFQKEKVDKNKTGFSSGPATAFKILFSQTNIVMPDTL